MSDCCHEVEIPPLTPSDKEQTEKRNIQRRTWVATLFTAPLMVLAMRSMHTVTLAEGWLQAGLALPVVLWSGAPFFHRGWLSLKSRQGNMFTLIALGTGVAFLYSGGLLIAMTGGTTPRALYFEAAAAIITLTWWGQRLEAGARERSGAAIRALLDLTPPLAHRLDSQGRAVAVPVSQVQVGDRLQVRPGEKFAVDGRVIEGQSAVDESMLTGEAAPVNKSISHPVHAGTLNGNGSLLIEATGVGQKTLLAQMVRLVGEAQRSRAPVQQLADRLAAVFVPLVCGIAGITALAWGFSTGWEAALVHATTVLIIACPCALGLATPVSVLVASGRGARAGILVRRAEALEQLATVDIVVFDKTGTLTHGEPRWETLEVFAPFHEAEVAEALMALEQSSEHPLARAVVAGAKARGAAGTVRATEFRASPGAGVSGQVGGRLVLIGSESWLTGEGVNLQAVAGGARALREKGLTLFFIAIDRRPAGFVAVSDGLRANAERVIDDLRAQGVRVILATGDHKQSATAIARQLGIKEIHAHLLPTDKQQLVRKLQQDGGRVAMVGDGINDAPAMAQATVGVAMGSGTDVAIQSGGLTLLGESLEGLLRARRLSEATRRNVRQNLAFAFIYNLVGVPLAAGLFSVPLNPIFGSVAMTLSSLSVIGNALRLQRVKL